MDKSELFSDKIPEVGYSPDIKVLFHYFGINFDTLSPALYIVCGVAFAFFLLRILKKIYYGE